MFSSKKVVLGVIVVLCLLLAGALLLWRYTTSNAAAPTANPSAKTMTPAASQIASPKQPSAAATTTVPPSSSQPPASAEPMLTRPPEIATYIKTLKSVSQINPPEFVHATDEVNAAFTQMFGEAYYLKRQNLKDLYKPQDLTKLEQVLASLPNLTTWEYKEDYFDCSEMSALTEYALEAAGFDTLIISSLDPTGTGDPRITTGHAWCVVVLKTPTGSQLIPIEATTPGGPAIPPKGKKSNYRARGKTGSQAYDEYITKGWVLVNIYEAYRYVPKDFEWWNSAKINRSWLQR